MTTITGNARFREAVSARLVMAMRPNQSIADTAVPDAQSSPSPGNYSIQVDTHQVLLQAHAFDPANLIGPWRASTVFAVGDVIFQTGIDADALLLECTAVAGTEETGATEPTWDTTPGNTTTDNEVTWETLGTISELSPITQFLYQPVLISAVSPETGTVDGGTVLTITGSGFAAFDANAGDNVTVGGQAATNAVANSDTEITCDTPAGTEGVVDVVVTIDGESAKRVGVFEYVVITGDPFWSHSFSSAGSTASLSQRLGYEFTVGVDDIVCNTLSYYGAYSTTTENVRVHRVSDGALVAEADIVPTSDAWVDQTVAEFTLAAGEKYTISFRAGGTSRGLYFNASGVTYYAGITYDRNVQGTSDALPTSNANSSFHGARFGYV